jgi:hypothetical protein
MNANKVCKAINDQFSKRARFFLFSSFCNHFVVLLTLLSVFQTTALGLRPSGMWYVTFLPLKIRPVGYPVSKRRATIKQDAAWRPKRTNVSTTSLRKPKKHAKRVQRCQAACGVHVASHTMGTVDSLCKVKTAKVWSWPLTSIQCLVDLHFRFPIAFTACTKETLTLCSDDLRNENNLKEIGK